MEDESIEPTALVEDENMRLGGLGGVAAEKILLIGLRTLVERRRGAIDLGLGGAPAEPAA